MFIDTHCHLNLESFERDYKKVIDRSFTGGVGTIINIGSDYKNSKRAVDLAKDYPQGVYAAVGMHPGDSLGEVYNEKKFSDLLYSKKVVAIGEIGLDYTVEKLDKVAQAELFKKQIDLAVKYSKPVVIHCREAYTDLIEILKSYENLPKIVMHCYVGNLADAKTFLEMGLYLSFTGIITFNKNEELNEVVKYAPLERIMIETDAPWLAPEPHRGHRNEPLYVIEIARKIAQIKNISLAEVEVQTTKNAQEFFGI
ncbi:MAG: TatD family hydrolase [Candidatus Berkelbacteria bacterium]